MEYRIEGIHTSDERLDALVKYKAEPRNRSEQEIAGYREVLALIHENYNYMTPRASVILQMHRDMYQFSPVSAGGKFKNSDNVIAEISSSGEKRVRFQPLPAFETPEAVDRLTDAFISAVSAERFDALLLIPMFILDFLCIHPFNDGNGRISRLLTLLLLYRSGYAVGKYISIEAIIERTKQSYYEALEESSKRWYDTQNTYLPFVRYTLEVILGAYKEFSDRMELMQNRKLTKPERVRALFGGTLQRLTKRMILEKCPDISESTVEMALAALLKEGYIIKTGAGKNTGYVRDIR